MGDNLCIKERYQLLELTQQDVLSDAFIGRDIQTHKSIWVVRYHSSILEVSELKDILELADRFTSFSHTHVARLLDVHFDGIQLYCVYEYDPTWQTLKLFFENQQGNNLKRLWKISTQILKGLNALSLANLFHGNLNFSNIWIQKDGCVLLNRAGIDAQIIRYNIDQLSVIDEGPFLSPDYFQTSLLSTQTDIYSFGVILFVIFSQDWPFSNSNNVAMIRKKFLYPPRDFIKIDFRVPDKLASIIATALQFNPADRFESFEELYKIYRKGELLAATQPSSAASEAINSPEARKRPLWFWGTVIAFVSISVYIFVQFSQIYSFQSPDIAVPDILGQSLADAQLTLQDYQLKSVIYSHRYSNIPLGHVIEIKPAPGRKVKAHREIRLILSKGRPILEIPDFTGRDFSQVQHQYTGANIALTIDRKIYSLKFPENYIVSQSIEAYTQLTSTEDIKLTLSKGLPIHVNISSKKEASSKILIVSVDCEVLPDWDRQNISIFYTRDDDRQKLYSDFHEPGHGVELVFKLTKGGNFEVYYNDELGYKKALK